jgi:hypothetical protein
MRQRAFIDISSYSFEEFVVFLFDRDVPEESYASLVERGGRLATSAHRPWYFDVEVEFDRQRVCDYYVQLFTEPSFLIDRFSREQLEQGFGAMQVHSLRCSVLQIIWDIELPFSQREVCVKAMLPLFRELFLNEPLGNVASMWWDSFCYAWQVGHRKRSRGGEDLTMQDAMFETLAEILALPSEICQGAALHGLSHLHHPGTEELIQNLSMHPSFLDDDWKQIALGAARFELL